MVWFSKPSTRLVCVLSMTLGAGILIVFAPRVSPSVFATEEPTPTPIQQTTDEIMGQQSDAAPETNPQPSIHPGVRPGAPSQNPESPPVSATGGVPESEGLTSGTHSHLMLILRTLIMAILRAIL
jgi:hypothetical protein